MTLETAKRARDILDKIRSIRNLIDRIRTSDMINISGYNKLENVFEIGCTKTNSYGAVVKHIIDGLEDDIQELEKELARL